MLAATGLRASRGTNGHHAPVRVDEFRSWLVRFGDAWEARDAEALAGLFAPGALFEVQPFETPLRGKPQIREHWSERFAGQADAAFQAEVLGVGETYGVAHWRTTFRPATDDPTTAVSVNGGIANAGPAVAAIDGVLMAAFDPRGRCTSLRQWWHEGAPLPGS
jgi:ketosteroid isomerase-like protein